MPCPLGRHAIIHLVHSRREGRFVHGHFPSHLSSLFPSLLRGSPSFRQGFQLPPKAGDSPAKPLYRDDDCMADNQDNGPNPILTTTFLSVLSPCLAFCLSFFSETNLERTTIFVGNLRRIHNQALFSHRSVAVVAFSDTISSHTGAWAPFSHAQTYQLGLGAAS